MQTDSCRMCVTCCCVLLPGSPEASLRGGAMQWSVHSRHTWCPLPLLLTCSQHTTPTRRVQGISLLLGISLVQGCFPCCNAPCGLSAAPVRWCTHTPAGVHGHTCFAGRRRQVSESICMWWSCLGGETVRQEGAWSVGSITQLPSTQQGHGAGYNTTCSVQAWSALEGWHPHSSA
jgi:hypothetical protein